MHGSKKVPMTPCPQHNNRISTGTSTNQRARFGGHNTFLAKYIRYLKLLTGKSVTITDLGIFSKLDGILSSIENVVTSTFRPCKINNHKDKPVKSLEHLANCSLANSLVCHTNSYHFNRNTFIKLSFWKTIKIIGS